MKKTFIRLTGLLVTTAIALSGNGLVLANEVENTGDDVVAATEEPANAAQDEGIGTPEEKPSEEKTNTNTDSGSQNNESNDNSDSSKSEPNKDSESQNETSITKTVTIDFNYDNNELAESYINHVFGIDSSSVSTKKALKRSYDPSANLSEFSKYTYDILRNHFIEIAAGRETSTEISILVGDYAQVYSVSELVDDPSDTKGAGAAAYSKLGLDMNAVFRALLNSCPYDLYWFDKTQDESVSLSYSYSTLIDSNGNKYVQIKSISTKFLVASEYRDNNNPYVVSNKFSTLVRTAHDNAISIVNTYKNLDDYKKLEAYKNKICDLVEYNHPAADDDDTPYGNPWQLIWVFDGNDSTTVVCEGYSKAFKYLCDNTSFKNDEIYVVCASGDVTLRNSNGAVTGGHMWNVVHMEDGKNYLVDVTNCDSGFYLFMKGYVATLSNGYVVSNGRGQNNDYPYRNTSITLPLASSDYVYTPNPNPEPEIAPSLIGHSMRLNDTIGLRFHIEFPNNFDTSNCYVSFEATDGKTSTVYYKDSEMISSNTRGFVFYINPLELADNITATLHYGNNNTIVSKPYSAMDYIEEVKSKMSYRTDLINLLNSLHSYGYYCQKAGWTDNKTHSTISVPLMLFTSADRATTLENVNSFNIETNIGTSGISSEIKTNMGISTNTVLKVYVKPTSGTTITSEAPTATINGETYYQFSTGKLGPKSLGNPKTITIKTSKGTATVAVASIYYVKSALISNKLSANEEYALIAFYNYYISAMAYNE